MKKPAVFSPPGEAMVLHDQPTYEQLARHVEDLERQLRERVRSEEALRESEQQYRSLVENTSDVIFTLSVDGAVTSLNSAFELLTGWVRNDWLGKPFFFLLHPEDLSFATQLFRRVVQKETPPVFVLRLRTSAGHYLHSELTVTPRIFEHTVIGVLGAMRDVTQRKRMEQALAYRTALEDVITTISTHFINLTLEEMDPGIVEGLRTLGEFTGVDRGSIVLFSKDHTAMGKTHEWCAPGITPQMSALQGVPVARVPWWMTKLHSFEVLHIPRVVDLPAEARVEQQLLETQGVQSTLAVAMVCGRSLIGFLQFDGVRREKVWSEEIIALLRLVGESFANALARKQVEIERRQVELLKDELVATVSHELRTPLTSLRGFAELMLTREFTQEKQRQFLSVIHNEAIRLTNLINDFLDLQRMESGRQVYHFEHLPLASVLQETLTVFVGAEHHHTFHLTVTDGLPPVRADSSRLCQVMTNLLSNAIKFSPQGGTITIGARQEEGNVMVWVTDQGVGIPPEAIPKLFRKFFRVDNQETRSIGGTGLGLALVKKIVEAHGGQVWVESLLGQGSTFFFSLPAITTTSKQTTETPSTLG